MLPEDWINYLVHFHTTRDYFECHEILEEYWKERGMNEEVWVGFIQLAVALYHERRGNRSGAEKMMASAHKKLAEEREHATTLGVNSEQLLTSMKNRLDQIMEKQNYIDMSIPLNQEALACCQQVCRKRGLTWESPSAMNDENLLHRHKMRDRSDVIAERKRQLLIRKTNDQEC
ncbi:DUF309 domain-containing protein [Fictibacillus iocasae]|uniref:DUF309 domain-containing protein n=1 Tax=Fictibacillus iocasae TaxID=2715437 RepID=A0ABW2NPR0_9BACL